MLPHLISTFAAVMAIVSIGTKEAYELIDVPKMRDFLLSLKNNGEEKTEKQGSCLHVDATLPGSFAAHPHGENDMRGVYCAIVVADVLGLLPEEEEPELSKGVGDYVASCQTYEGGLSCTPLGEAHGGYTYCGLATLVLLGETSKLRLDSLTEWLVGRY